MGEIEGEGERTRAIEALLQQQKDPKDSVTERARQQDGKMKQDSLSHRKARREQERLGGHDGARKEGRVRA